jgi:hypothetical protein
LNILLSLEVEVGVVLLLAVVAALVVSAQEPVYLYFLKLITQSRLVVVEMQDQTQQHLLMLPHKDKTVRHLSFTLSPLLEEVGEAVETPP